MFAKSSTAYTSNQGTHRIPRLPWATLIRPIVPALHQEGFDDQWRSSCVCFVPGRMVPLPHGPTPTKSKSTQE